MASMIQVLTDVYAETISLDDDVSKRAKQIVTEVVKDTFINAMREEDVLFRSLYRDIFYTGSFYDGLRVGEATEFDLNVVLRLPFCYGNDFCYYDKNSSVGETFGVVPGYALLCSKKSFNLLMPRTHDRYNDYKKLESFFVCTSGYYVFHPEKLRSLFKGVAVKARSNVIRERKLHVLGMENITINIVESGPATTLNILADGLSIDVDLVPVIQFQSDQVFLVPKPHSSDEKMWRLSYPLRERKIIYDNSCAKKVIKLLKRFRDMQGAPWVKMSSYYLKTLVMLTLEDKWHEKQFDKFFIECLEKLLDFVKKHYLPFYFDPECNLFENIYPSTMRNIEGRLKRVLKDITTNCVTHPEGIRKYFMQEECNPESDSGTSRNQVVRQSIPMMIPPDDDDDNCKPANGSTVSVGKFVGGAIAVGAVALGVTAAVGVVSAVAEARKNERRKDERRQLAETNNDDRQSDECSLM